MNARVALCLLIASCALPALAKDAAPSGDKAQKPPVSAEEQAMMEAWQAAGTPGKHHAYLEPLVGTFDVKVSSWMEPDAPVQKSTGRSENRFVLDGRHLEQRFEGSFMEMPFEGIGYVGYDNLKKQYTSTWMDSMGTATMVSIGKVDASGKALTFSGECTDPMTGKPATFRQELTIRSNDEHVFEMWTPDPKTGTEFKTMELAYSRAAGTKLD